MILINKQLVLQFYKSVANQAHKGTQGHALIIGGSYGKMGSISLSSKACLTAGCGLVTVFIPKCGYQIVQIFVPEVMVLTDIEANYISQITIDFIPDAIGIGPGLGQDLTSQKALHELLLNNKAPLVIDADALNILSKNPKWLDLLPKETIITPHPKELERLIGPWDSEEEKMKLAKAFSIKYQLVLVMKGAPTQIVFGNEIYKNTTGNAALATAGTGDVLTGIITSLLAQNYNPLHAAQLGVFLHGLTADIALPEKGYQSFIASDVISYLGKAYLNLESIL